MRKLDLDYQRLPRRTTWASWALLLAGCALCGEMALSYAKLQQEMGKLEQALPTAGTAREAPERVARQDYSPAELAKARETIDRIAVPWGDLFKAVETVRTDRVALLALEPDSRAGTLKLSGEARDFPSLLSYLERLGRTGLLYDVYLLRHEIRQNNPQHAVAFVIAARWGEQP